MSQLPIQVGSQTGAPNYQQALQSLQNVYGNLYGNAYQTYRKAQSQGLAGMMGAGLGGTSLYPGVRTQAYNQYQQSVDQLAAQQGQQQAQLGLSYNQLGLQQQGVAQGWQGLNLQQQGMDQNYGMAQQQMAYQQANQQASQQPQNTYFPGSYVAPDMLMNQFGGQVFG